MHAVAVMAIAGVAPIQNEQSAVGPITQVNAAEPGVGREEHVVLVAAEEPAAGSLEAFHVHAAAVEIHREKLAAVGGGPLVAQVD